MKIRGFKDLEVWKRGKQLSLSIYAATGDFPLGERFGLSAQMRRAAISVPSSVSEGFNRRYTKEFVRFLYDALGSCGELETQIEIARDLGYVDVNQTGRLISDIQIEARLLRSLIRGLE